MLFLKSINGLFTVFSVITCLGATAMANSITLNATVRDFKAFNTAGGHPDFESFLGVDPGIVGNVLPANKRPSYNGIVGNPTTTGAANFDMWFGGPAVVGIDPGLVIPQTLTLDETSPGVFTFISSSFFPIDGLGYGNQGNSHNYHFTLDLHSQFTYQPGQTFDFTGDDDVWVYINNQLALDLGGVHGAQSASINLATLGLTPGTTYDFDFYFAERHTTGSNLQVTTSIPIRSNPVPESGGLLGAIGVVFAAMLIFARRASQSSC